MMKVNPSAKKIAQISFIYGLALTTAIACGQGFKANSIEEAKAKALNQNQNTTGGGNTVDASYQPQITSVSKTDMRETYGTSYELQFTIVDGSRGANVATYHYGVNSSFDGKSQLVDGRFTYMVRALCTDANCNQVVALVERADRNSTGVPQSTFVVTGSTYVQQMNPSLVSHGTTFQTLSEALTQVRNQSSSGGAH